MTVLVVGGGISGLAAAHELSRAGIPALVVEAGGHPGGKIATERVDGFTIEHGPDSMLATRPAGVALARAVGLGRDLVGVREPRLVHILRDGRPIPMPDGLGLILPTRMHPFVATRLFSWPEKARMALDLVLPRVMAAADEPVGSYLRRRLGSALVDRLAGPLVGGIYGTSIDELSLDAVVPTLRDAERTHRSLLLAGLADGRRMRAAAAKARAAAAAAATSAGSAGDAAGAPARPLGVFVSIRGGLGDLVDGIVRAIDAGGTTTFALETRVLALEPAGAGLRARLSDGRTPRFDAAIVTTEGPAAAALLGPFAPVAAAAVASIPHASSTVVTLAYPIGAFPEPPVGHGWLVPASEGLPVSALTWSSNKWADRAPDGALLVRAFLPGEPAGGRPAAELVDLARGALRRLAGVTAAPDLVRVASFAGTMPRYTVGHLDRVARADRALAEIPAVRLAGAPYRGVGLPDCIAGAGAAVAAIREHLGMADAGTSIESEAVLA